MFHEHDDRHSKGTIHIDITLYGYDASLDPACGHDYGDLLPARVVWMRRARYGVVCERGERTATLRGALLHRASRAELPAVGDFVRLRIDEGDAARIESLLPRRSSFSRVDLSGHIEGYAKTAREQVVAANFDDVFVLSSLNHDCNARRIARYVTQALRGGGNPVIVLTKADLCEDREALMAPVREMAPGVDIVVVSSVTGEGLDALSRYLRPGRTIALLGMSGVGKSSLLNRLAGEEWMDVGEIREDDARGRHTTTHRELFRLPSGALIIDTPGMRELGLWDAQDGIREGFRDVEDIALRCRFANCRHDAEPGCAVRAALDEGVLPRARWEAYSAQRREAARVSRMCARDAGKGKATNRNANSTRKEAGSGGRGMGRGAWEDDG